MAIWNNAVSFFKRAGKVVSKIALWAIGLGVVALVISLFISGNTVHIRFPTLILENVTVSPTTTIINRPNTEVTIPREIPRRAETPIDCSAALAAVPHRVYQNGSTGVARVGNGFCLGNGTQSYYYGNFISRDFGFRPDVPMCEVWARAGGIRRCFWRGADGAYRSADYYR